MKQRIIGYASTCYGMRRVSHDLPVGAYGIEYRRIRRAPLHRIPFAPDYWWNRYYFPLRPRVDAIHLFNGICASPLPWVSSIEMEYPRYFGQPPKSAFRQAFEQLASENCRLLLPMSQAARQHLLSRIEDRWLDRISSKLVVFSGGVRVTDRALAAREIRLRQRPDTFTVGFVGRLFWHKGGPAVVRAVAQLRSAGADVRLFVVSDLLAQSHIVDVPAAEVDRVRHMLSSTPWIDYYPQLPNEQVLLHLAECDVFAFPTLDESLGWVAIEAIALGLPVITTNVFAIPEIVEHEREGIVIQLPLDRDRRWTGIPSLNPTPRPSYEDADSILFEGCLEALRRLHSDAELRSRMGHAARAKYLGRFDESTAARRLSGCLRTSLD